MYMQAGVVTVENAGGDIDKVTGKRMIIAAFPFRCEMADGGLCAIGSMGRRFLLTRLKGT